MILTRNVAEELEHTSSEKRPLSPVHGQHDPRPQTNTLGKVNTTPEIHSQDATAEVQTTKVKDGGVANVRQASEMFIIKGLIDSLVKVTVVDLVGLHAGHGSCNLSEFAAEVLALLVCALGGGGKGGEFRVNLVEEFGEFFKVKGA